MSDKITPLHPERERRRRIRKRVFLLIGSTAVVLLVLVLILFWQELNLDKVRRYITYLTVRDSNTYGEYVFDDHSSNACSALGDGLAVASVGGLDLYGPSGEVLATISKQMDMPALEVGGELAVAWDVGGTALCAASVEEGNVLELDTSRQLLDVSVSGTEELCYAAVTDGYKTVLTVLDSDRQEIYRWYSSTRYLPICAIGEGGGQVAAVAYGQANGTFESRLLLLNTAEEESEGQEMSLGDEMIYDLSFLTSRRICAVGESQLILLDSEGAQVGSYDYGGSYLMDYDLSGSGFAVLTLNPYQAGSLYSVVTVDTDGTELASVLVGEEVLDVSAAGNYVAVLTASRMLIYTSDLNLYAETDEVSGISQTAMRPDGSVLLIGNGGAHLYLP